MPTRLENKITQWKAKVLESDYLSLIPVRPLLLAVFVFFFWQCTNHGKAQNFFLHSFAVNGIIYGRDLK